MTSIGDTLRRERLRRNLDIVSIAGELKISTRFLEAIEADDFAKLPGGVFTKSFVRQYAAFLGLDANEVLAELHRTAEPEPEVLPLAAKAKPNVPGMRVQSREIWGSIGGRGLDLPPSVRAGALLVALMLVCSAVYWWWQRPRHTAAAVEVPVARAIAPPQPAPPVSVRPPTAEPAAPAATTPLSAEQTVTTSPVAAPPVASAPTSAPAPNLHAPVRVAITAEIPVWIRVEVNGKHRYSGTLHALETRNFDGDGQVKVRVGNAGRVTMALNGKPIGPIGPKGQIRIVQFTSGGFQIVSPPISFDPLDRL